MGRTSKSAAIIHAIPWIKDMMKCPFVNGEVTRATPFSISAGLNPVPAKPNPETTNSQKATVRRGLPSTDAAIAPPAIASKIPGAMKPMRFQGSAWSDPSAPSSLTAFAVCEYDGRSAPKTNSADQQMTAAAIPRNPAVRLRTIEVNSDLLLEPSQPERAGRCGKVCINLSAVHKTSLRVVIAEERVLRNALDSNPRPAESHRSLACPFQKTTTELLVGPLAPYREVVHVHSIIFCDFWPHDRLTQQQPQRTDQRIATERQLHFTPSDGFSVIARGEAEAARPPLIDSTLGEPFG